MSKKAGSETGPAREPAEAAFLGMAAKITKLVSEESDRGAILILASYVEEILGLVVRAACVSEKLADEMLTLRKPAGDFDSRILVTAALGLIHDEDVRGLRLVQRIRNRAAHFDRSGKGFDVLFDSTETIDQVCRLAEVLALRSPTRDRGSIRATFVVAVRALAMRLLFRLGQVRPGVEPVSASDYAKSIRSRLEEAGLVVMARDLDLSAAQGDVDKVLEVMALAIDAMELLQKSPA